MIIGGAPFNEQVGAFSGADYCSKDAVVGVSICKEIFGTYSASAFTEAASDKSITIGIVVIGNYVTHWQAVVSI